MLHPVEGDCAMALAKVALQLVPLTCCLFDTYQNMHTQGKLNSQ